MPNYITNTAIVDESWNARGLITHNAVTKALIREDDSTLWAAVREDSVKKYINIYRSDDNGFSWQRKFSGDFKNTNRRQALAGLNQNGPFMHLTLNEERDRLILWHTYYDVPEKQYDLEPFIFDVGADGELTRHTDVTEHAVDTITLDADQMAFDVSYTNEHIYLTYTSFSNLNVKTYHHTYQSSHNGHHTLNGSYFNVFATHANDNNTLNIMVLRDVSPNFQIEYTRYHRKTGSFTTPVKISNFPAADVRDMNLVKDGNDTLLAVWAQENSSGTQIRTKYSLSYNNGASWTTPQNVPYEPGQTAYTDPPTGRLAARSVALAGLQGFLIGYVRKQDGVPAGFIRHLAWDGANYHLQEEKEAVESYPCDGFRFFLPVDNQRLDFGQLDQVRIAYSIGSPTSTQQSDHNPVRFGQHILREVSGFRTEQAKYVQDNPEPNQLLVRFNLLGGTNENVDYYAEGLHGAYTRRYIGAFKKVATRANFYRYEPDSNAESSDRSAYNDPDVYSSLAIIQSVNYDFPIHAGNEDFSEYIERDTRKVHLPPDFHLDRTFLVNAGNHLKRTVWLMRYDGNEYELSQVVPRFINNQIAYYMVNGYVVGPSNDPFARRVLPSET